MTTGTGALAGPSEPPLQDNYQAQMPASEGGTVNQTDVPILNRTTNSKLAGVNQATQRSKSKQVNHGNNGG